MIIGIDASNINDGGGVTHLAQIINNFNIDKSNLTKIIIWGNNNTLNKIKNKKKIKKIILDKKYKNIFLRFIWQFFFLENEIKKYNCNKAFVPGGISFLRNIPTIIVMQNILPFNNFAFKKYSFILKLKFLIQKLLFINSINKAEKVIFISKTSKKQIFTYLKNKHIKYKIIPHGVISNKFSRKNFNFKKKIKLLCVSKIDFYKNQFIILKAIKILIDQGFNVKLKLIGSNFKSALKEIEKNIIDLNLKNNVEIKNELNFKQINHEYKNSNIHISPSICESFGITVIESGNHSLPSICSDIDIFKEITKNKVFFFDPFDELDLVNTIKRVIKNKIERKNKIKEFYNFINKNYSWKKVAFQTFNFIQK